ncbi:PHB depolymerase family esterase [soil metagenome]
MKTHQAITSPQPAVQFSLIAVALTAACLSGCATPSSSLPALGEKSLQRYTIDPAQVSVSGVSGGGAMASQLHIAYSSVFKKGAGLFAAPPYYCAEGSLMAGLACSISATEDKKPNVAKLVEQTRSWSGNRIDPLSNLASTRVYIFSGSLDTRVKPMTVNETFNFYTSLIPRENVFYKSDLAAAHSMVTSTYGNACDGYAAPYLNNCNFDLAGETLRWIHGMLNARTGAIAANFHQFDQNEFRPADMRDTDGIDSTGWVYVPSACKKGAVCKLHVALHGCQQGQAQVAEKFYKYAGYNEWAESNNMIVLYPQNVPSGKTGTPAFNPAGCWDWWGYTGAADYATKAGVQPTAIVKMVNRLKGSI